MELAVLTKSWNVGPEADHRAACDRRQNNRINDHKVRPPLSPPPAADSESRQNFPASRPAVKPEDMENSTSLFLSSAADGNRQGGTNGGWRSQWGFQMDKMCLCVFLGGVCGVLATLMGDATAVLVDLKGCRH